MKRLKHLALYLMALLSGAAGINHFINPGPYVQIMPRWLAWHKELVALSGLIEIILALLLLFPKTRQLAAWGIIVLLVAVFPANVQMYADYRSRQDALLWIAALRLPLQLLLIGWAFLYTRPAGRAI